ncbi:response regulator [Pyxidicoccus fallax]|uniref:Response regulator n=1 Tax=Pyxidicoccus fallax TaxID=394095 RepID=A0A848LKK4_9BACT|nr:response regulator [Pyxidicoccus fallax]NMO18246.1 response regulator [Pyxidicoccus fallax]NPC79992.1 response regulator [Pyxidicoccus fallax]
MNGAHVLVVDDDPDVLEVVTLTLEMAGYRVSQAANGQLALAELARELPGLILLDMRMPVMDGWTFARELRARHGHRIPVVVVTAAEDARLRAREVDAEAWLGKPFDVDTLLATVGRLMARQGGLEASRSHGAP